MKYSKYNVFSEKSKLMYNTLNQSMVQLSPEVFNGFKKEDPELFTKLTDFKSYMENGKRMGKYSVVVHPILM